MYGRERRHAPLLYNRTLPWQGGKEIRVLPGLIVEPQSTTVTGTSTHESLQSIDNGRSVASREFFVN